MAAVAETALRSALAAMLGDPQAALPADIRTDIQEHLARRDASGATLCFAGPERDAIVTRLLAWADAKGVEVGSTLRKAIGMPLATGEKSQGSHHEVRSSEMVSIDDVALDVQEESPTVALYGDLMTQLSIVRDELTVAPYNTPPEKLEKAYEAVLEERVTPQPLKSGEYLVASRQKAEGLYEATVRGTCTCQYALMHSSERFGCYHPVAAKLYQRWQQNQRPLVAPLLPSVPEVHMTSPLPVEGSRMAQEPLLPRVLSETLPPCARSITAIVADLSRPLPAGCVSSKTVKGTTVDYLHWQTVARLLDTYAPGWHGTVTRLEPQGQTVRITYRLSIPCAEGLVMREATGEDDEWDAEEKTRYGNPSANAQANAFKRAAVLFGCGQWLYDKPQDPTAKALAAHLKEEKADALAALGKALVQKGMARTAALAWLKTQAGVTTLSAIPFSMIRTLLSSVAQQDDVADLPS